MPTADEIAAMSRNDLQIFLLNNFGAMSSEQTSAVFLNLLTRLSLVEGQALGLIARVQRSVDLDANDSDRFLERYPPVIRP